MAKEDPIEIARKELRMARLAEAHMDVFRREAAAKDAVRSAEDRLRELRQQLSLPEN